MNSVTGHHLPVKNSWVMFGVFFTTISESLLEISECKHPKDHWTLKIGYFEAPTPAIQVQTLPLEGPRSLGQKKKSVNHWVFFRKKNEKMWPTIYLSSIWSIKNSPWKILGLDLITLTPGCRSVGLVPRDSGNDVKRLCCTSNDLTIVRFKRTMVSCA